MKILFICRGNVGRSQMAEALLKKEAGESFEVFSAGTKLSGPEQPIDELAPATNEVIEVMKEIDIDISKNIRNQVTEDMANSADKIILVVDENDSIPDYLINNTKVLRWNVLDPKGQSLEFTRKIRDQIFVHVKELIQDIGKTVKFAPNLVPLVLSGEKTSTWRLFDDKNLQAGDHLNFVNKENGEEFGKAIIIDVREIELGKIEDSDYDGYEKFESKEKMIETYQGYYGNKVTPETILKIIKFKLL